jgi:hypothetical protein
VRAIELSRGARELQIVSEDDMEVGNVVSAGIVKGQAQKGLCHVEMRVFDVIVWSRRLHVVDDGRRRRACGSDGRQRRRAGACRVHCAVVTSVAITVARCHGRPGRLPAARVQDREPRRRRQGRAHDGTSLLRVTLHMSSSCAPPSHSLMTRATAARRHRSRR